MELVRLQGPSIRERLRQNMIPSDAQRTTILQSLDVARARLSHLIVTNLSPSVHPDTTALEKYIAEYSSLLSGIRRLPDDLLQLIFLHPDIHGYLSAGNRNSGPVVAPDTPHIAAVCSYWRCVLIQTPMFWASISVPIRAGQETLSILQLFLQRSQNVPLSLDIKSGEQSFPMHPGIIDALIQQSGRWLRISVPPGVIAEALISPSRIYALESFVFKENIRGVGRARITVAPELRTLTIERLSQIEDVPELPLRQIRKLYVQTQGPICGQLLPMLPNLTHLTIRPNYWETPNLPNPPLSPSVREITILQDNTVLFVNMNFPNLKRLQVVDCDKWNFSSLEAHRKRSGCQLNTLVLQNVRIRGPDLLELLRTLPALETLEIMKPFPNSILDGVLAALTPRSGSSELVLPILARIVWTGAYLFSTDALLKMLEARRDTNNPLAEVDIILRDRVVSTSDLERFAGLRGSGFASLVCLDQDKNWVRICNGHWLRLPAGQSVLRPAVGLLSDLS
ncbi:hypothetical protein DFH06DRAFT_1414080 [Mycena polygramma]|nr:hypothetical protein DFH06DRAFT_1414080 [Mycena polygramma]